MTTEQIKTWAHNSARRYMTSNGRPNRYSLMSEADRKLFLYIRGVNISIITK